MPAKTPDEKKLVDLLKRTYGQKKRLKGAQKVVASAKRALNKLKGKVAKTRARIAASKVTPPEKAVRWFMSQQGVAEKPDGSNWGVPVQNWIKSTGYSSPVPWCGCATKVAVVDHGKAKIPTPIRLGYTGYIEEDARAKRNGLTAVAFDKGKKGDIVVFGFGHIAVLREDVRPGSSVCLTIEGNTSPLSSGSQNNGGTVAAKTRSRSDVTVITRPKYPRS